MYKTGIQLPIGTRIGGGLTFSHFSCIIIHYDAVIGENCTIFQGVTIGSTRGKGLATIGNNVILFAGAKVVSHVIIGDNVVVGANSVVINDIPIGSVAVGIPAKVVNGNAEKILKLYI